MNSELICWGRCLDEVWMPLQDLIFLHLRSLLPHSTCEPRLHFLFTSDVTSTSRIAVSMYPTRDPNTPFIIQSIVKP